MVGNWLFSMMTYKTRTLEAMVAMQAVRIVQSSERVMVSR